MDLIVHCVVNRIQLRIRRSHVAGRAVEQIRLQIRVRLLHLIEPCIHVCQKPRHVRCRFSRRVILQDRDLADTGLDHLGKFVLKNLNLALIDGVRQVDGIVHKGMQRVNEKALALVSRLSQPGNLLQILFRIQGTPFGIVIGIILRCKHVLVHLDLTAELHQIHPVVHGPGVSVVAFDKSAELHLRVIPDGQLTHAFSVQLLEDPLQRGHTVVGSVHVLTQDHDILSVDPQGIGIILFIKRSFRAVCLSVNIRLITGTVHTHDQVCAPRQRDNTFFQSQHLQRIVNPLFRISVDVLS